MPTCECGDELPNMDRFVDHVTNEHDVLDVAVAALRADRGDSHAN